MGSSNLRGVTTCHQSSTTWLDNGENMDEGNPVMAMWNTKMKKATVCINILTDRTATMETQRPQKSNKDTESLQKKLRHQHVG